MVKKVLRPISSVAVEIKRLADEMAGDTRVVAGGTLHAVYVSRLRELVRELAKCDR